MDPRSLLAGLAGMEGSDTVKNNSSSKNGNSGDARIQQLAGALLQAMGGANAVAADADNSNMQQKPQALATDPNVYASTGQQKKQKLPPPRPPQQKPQPNLQEMLDALKKTAQPMPTAAARTNHVPVTVPVAAVPPPAAAASPPQESAADTNSQAMSMLLATLGPKGVQELLNQKVNGSSAPTACSTNVASVPVAQVASLQPQPASSSSQLSLDDQLAMMLVKQKIQESQKVYEENMKQQQGAPATASDANESAQKMQELEAQAAMLMQQSQQKKAPAPGGSNYGNGPVDMAQLQFLLQQQQQQQARLLAQQQQQQQSVDLLKALLSKSNNSSHPSNTSVAPSAASIMSHVSGGASMVSENNNGGLDIKQLALLAQLQQQQQSAVQMQQQQQPPLDAQRLAALLSQQRQQSKQTTTSTSLVMGSNNSNNGNSMDQLKRLTELIQGGGQQQQQQPHFNLGMLGLANASLPPATIVTNNNRMKTDPTKPEKKRRRGRTGTFPQKMHQMLDGMEKVRT